MHDYAEMSTRCVLGHDSCFENITNAKKRPKLAHITQTISGQLENYCIYNILVVKYIEDEQN